MENNEPLLKEKEERFPFLDEVPKELPKTDEEGNKSSEIVEESKEEKESSEITSIKEQPQEENTSLVINSNEEKKEPTLVSKQDKNKPTNFPLIFTIILSILIGVFIYFKVIIPFYNGFKYYDLRYEDKNNEPIEDNNKNNNEEEIDLTSYILNDTYSKIDITDTNELRNLYSVFYGSGIEYTRLNSNQKLSLILAYLGITCENQTIGANDLSNAALKIFNDDSFVSTSSITSDDFIMNYDPNTITYSVSMNICPTNSEITKKITKATIKDNDLYIYESLTENGINREYKWTYKKGNNGNYSFSSIIPL